jgi:hypothetical protein
VISAVFMRQDLTRSLPFHEMRLLPILPSGEETKLDGLSPLYRLRIRVLAFEPLVDPATYLFFPVAVFSLQLSLKLLVVTFDLEQVIVCKIAPLLFEFTLELSPSPFELIRIHNRGSFLCLF